MSELNLVLPKVETETIVKDYGRFIISPLERGYGVTLGNTLKRILLSSLPGAAVSSVRVSGVDHASSKIPQAREDMTDFILNLKLLRLKLSQSEPARLHATVKGAGVVTAGDLEIPPHVEIVNPDLHLLRSDSPDMDLDMELFVEIGRGYSPVEEREDTPRGEVALDATFSPVRKATFKVERARVGQATDYDRLVVEITTDGSISPQDALREAAHLSVRHLALIADTDDEIIQEIVQEEEVTIPPISDTSIEELELTVRAYNSLKRSGITQVSEIVDKLNKGADEITSIRNFGQKSLNELLDRLEEKGFLEDIDENVIAMARAG